MSESQTRKRKEEKKDSPLTLLWIGIQSESINILYQVTINCYSLHSTLSKNFVSYSLNPEEGQGSINCLILQIGLCKPKFIM